MRRLWLPAVLALGSVAGAQTAAKKVCAVEKYALKVGDGVSLDTAAIQKAIDDCASAGGGTVRLSGAPVFVSAPLVLKSHITLEIGEGTTLQGSTHHEDYPEITEFKDKGRQSLLSARNAEDITIRGGGTIDGMGASWWVNPAQSRPRLIVFDHCKHVLMENVTVKDSPMWQIVPYYSEDLTFRNMRITAPTPAGHNTDGIDPFASKKVLIEHVVIDTGDDNVAIKSGQPGSAGPDDPTTDVTIRDCVFLKGHGLSVGSEVAGGVQHVHVERVSFKGTTQGIRLKSGRDRGGDLSDFTYKDITMEDVGTAFMITDYYGSPKGFGPDQATPVPATRLTPHFAHVRVENLTVKSAKVGIDIEGLPEAPVEDVQLKNVQITATKGGRIAYATVNAQGLVVNGNASTAVATGPGFQGALK